MRWPWREREAPRLPEGHDPPSAALAPPRLPGYGQGTPEPADLPRRTYGAGDTIHQTGTIDVQVDAATGEVVAVWFRCLSLPFQVWDVPFQTLAGSNDHIAVESITYVERGQ